MIDEYPILAVAASFAEGTTRMRGLKELRVKESDRLAATAAMLRVNGVEVEIEGDDLIVHGTAAARPAAAWSRPTWITASPCRRWSWGSRASKPVEVDDTAFIATSFPGFVRADAAARARELDMIIAIDGPAASGKGTLGKRLAAHYGLRHLDTGLLYRAVAKALLDAGRPLDDVAAAVAAARSARSGAVRRGRCKVHAVGEAASRRLGHPRGARGAARVPARFRRARPRARCSTAATSAR